MLIIQKWKIIKTPILPKIVPRLCRSEHSTQPNHTGRACLGGRVRVAARFVACLANTVKLDELYPLLVDTHFSVTKLKTEKVKILLKMPNCQGQSARKVFIMLRKEGVPSRENGVRLFTITNSTVAMR